MSAPCGCTAAQLLHGTWTGLGLQCAHGITHPYGSVVITASGVPYHVGLPLTMSGGKHHRGG